MNKLLITTLVLGVVSADIGLSYKNYKVPDTSYGVPSFQYSNYAGDSNTGYTGADGYNYKAQSSAQTGYQGSSFGQQNTGYQTGYQTSNLGDTSNNYQSVSGASNPYYQTLGSGNSFSTVSQPSYQYSTGAASQGGYQYQASSQYQASAVQKYQEFYNQWQQQPVQVFKHFYVHAAPEEPEKPKIRQPVVLPAPQKHYKIIFIKTPTQTVYTPQYIPVPQQNEEKTIVYVLVKKPEEQHEVVVPKIEQKPPTKPEVFFIKYKNKADSQAVINNIVNDYNKGDSGNFVSGSGGLGTGQYNTGSGQYAQGAYNQYAQGGQSGSQLPTGNFGSQSYGNSANSAASSSGLSTAGIASSVASSINYNPISTSQGVPHETYGPPIFRV